MKEVCTQSRRVGGAGSNRRGTRAGCLCFRDICKSSQNTLGKGSLGQSMGGSGLRTVLDWEKEID